MEQYFKHGSFKSTLEAITDLIKAVDAVNAISKDAFSDDALKNQSKDDIKNNSNAISKDDVFNDAIRDAIKDEFKVFYDAVLDSDTPLYNIVLTRQLNELYTSRDELIQLINESDGKVKEFYKLFLFEPITYLEKVNKFYETLTNGFDADGKLYLTILQDEKFIEQFINNDLKDKNDCLLTKFSNEQLENEIADINELKLIIKSQKDKYLQGGFIMDISEASNIFNIYDKVSAQFRSLSTNHKSKPNYSSYIDSNVKNNFRYDICSNDSTVSFRRVKLVNAVCGTYSIFISEFSDAFNRCSFENQLIKKLSNDLSRVVNVNNFNQYKNENDRAIISFCLYYFKDDFNDIIKNMIQTITNCKDITCDIVNKLDNKYLELLKDNNELKLTGGMKRAIANTDVKYITKEVPKYITKEVIKEIPKYLTKEVIKEVPKEVIREIPKEVIREVIKQIPNESMLGGAEDNHKETATETFIKERFRITKEFTIEYKSSWESIKAEMKKLIVQYAGKRLENRYNIKDVVMSIADVKPEARVMIKNILGFGEVDMSGRYLAALAISIKNCDKVNDFSSIKASLQKIYDALKKARLDYNTALNRYISARRIPGEAIKAMFDNLTAESIEWKISEIEEYTTIINRFLYMLTDKSYETKFEKENIDNILKEGTNKENAIRNYYTNLITTNNTRASTDKDITPRQRKYLEDVNNYYNLVMNVMIQYYNNIDVKFTRIYATGLSHKYSIKSYDVIVNILRNYLIGFSEVNIKKHFAKFASSIKQLDTTTTLKDLFDMKTDKGADAVNTIDKKKLLVSNPFVAIKALRKILGSIGYVKTLVEILSELQIINPQESEQITKIITEVNVLSTFVVDNPVEFKVQSGFGPSINRSIFSYDILTVALMNSDETIRNPLYTKGSGDKIHSAENIKIVDIPINKITNSHISQSLSKVATTHPQTLSKLIVEAVAAIVLISVNSLVQGNFKSNLLGNLQGGLIKNSEIDNKTNISELENALKYSLEGGNAAFAMIKHPETVYTEFILEAVPFYIIGYHIINYYFSVYYDKDETVNKFSLTISKYSPLYPIFEQLKTKQSYADVIKNNKDPYQSLTDLKTHRDELNKLLSNIHYTLQDLKVLIGCLNKIWKTSESQDIKYKISSSVSKLFGELNSGLVFLNRFSIESLKFGNGTQSMMIDMKIDKYLNDIKQLMDISSTYTVGNIYDTEKGFADHINEMEKLIKEAPEGHLEKLYALLANTTMSTVPLNNYYKFMETAFTPLLICKSAYEKVFSLFTFRYTDQTYDIDTNDVRKAINIINAYYDEGYDSFKEILDRFIDEDYEATIRARKDIIDFIRLNRPSNCTKSEKARVIKLIRANANAANEAAATTSVGEYANINNVDQYKLIKDYCSQYLILSMSVDDISNYTNGYGKDLSKLCSDKFDGKKRVKDIINAYNNLVFQANVDNLIHNKYPEFVPWDVHDIESYPSKIPNYNIQNTSTGNMLKLIMLYPAIDYKTASLWTYFEAVREEYVNDLKHYMLTIASFPNIPREQIKVINDYYKNLDNHTEQLRQREYDTLSKIKVNTLPIENIYPSADTNVSPGDTVRITSIHPLGISTTSKEFEAFRSNDNKYLGSYAAKIEGSNLFIYDSAAAQASYRNEEYAQKSQVGNDCTCTWNFADWAINIIASCDTLYKRLPYILYQAIKTNYYLNTYIKEATCDYKSIVFQEITPNRYYCLITQSIMLRSAIEMNKLTSSDVAQMSPMWISNLVGIMPYVINGLRAVSKTMKESDNEYKLYQNLITVLTNLYNQLVQFKPNTPFMNDVGITKTNFYSLAACFSLMNMSPMDVRDKLTWANQYFYGNTNLVFTNNNGVFDYIKEFLGNDFKDTLSGDSFETTLAILGKNTIMGYIANDNSTMMNNNVMYGGADVPYLNSKLGNPGNPTESELREMIEYIVLGLWNLRKKVFFDLSYILAKEIRNYITKQSLRNISQYVKQMSNLICVQIVGKKASIEIPGKTLIVFTNNEYDVIYYYESKISSGTDIDVTSADYKNATVSYVLNAISSAIGCPWNYKKFDNEFDSDINIRMKNNIEYVKQIKDDKNHSKLYEDDADSVVKANYEKMIYSVKNNSFGIDLDEAEPKDSKDAKLSTTKTNKTTLLTSLNIHKLDNHEKLTDYDYLIEGFKLAGRKIDNGYAGLVNLAKICKATLEAFERHLDYNYNLDIINLMCLVEYSTIYEKSLTIAPKNLTKTDNQTLLSINMDDPTDSATIIKNDTIKFNDIELSNSDKSARDYINIDIENNKISSSSAATKTIKYKNNELEKILTPDNVKARLVLLKYLFEEGYKFYDINDTENVLVYDIDSGDVNEFTTYLPNIKNTLKAKVDVDKLYVLDGKDKIKAFLEMKNKKDDSKVNNMSFPSINQIIAIKGNNLAIDGKESANSVPDVAADTIFKELATDANIGSYMPIPLADFMAKKNIISIYPLEGIKNLYDLIEKTQTLPDRYNIPNYITNLVSLKKGTNDAIVADFDMDIILNQAKIPDEAHISRTGDLSNITKYSELITDKCVLTNYPYRFSNYDWTHVNIDHTTHMKPKNDELSTYEITDFIYGILHSIDKLPRDMIEKQSYGVLFGGNNPNEYLNLLEVMNPKFTYEELYKSIYYPKEDTVNYIGLSVFNKLFGRTDKIKAVDIICSIFSMYDVTGISISSIFTQSLMPGTLYSSIKFETIKDKIISTMSEVLNISANTESERDITSRTALKKTLLNLVYFDKVGILDETRYNNDEWYASNPSVTKTFRDILTNNLDEKYKDGLGKDMESLAPTFFGFNILYNISTLKFIIKYAEFCRSLSYYSIDLDKNVPYDRSILTNGIN